MRLGDESAVTDAELFCCVELDAGHTEAWVRQASRVDRAWLAGELVTVQGEAGLGPGRVARRQARRASSSGSVSTCLPWAIR